LVKIAGFLIDKPAIMIYNGINKKGKGQIMAEFENDLGLEELEPDIIELDGEQFEIIDALTFEGVNYLALIPYDENEDEDDEEDAEFIVLKEVEENGEYFLSTIDDDELSDRIGELFLAHFDELMENAELDE
jgi:hypothetical protein